MRRTMNEVKQHQMEKDNNKYNDSKLECHNKLFSDKMET